ncbi:MULTISPECIES: hypothetical protein [Streptomyces]|uniref:Lipoprotein n=2 Tax=Streptomyces TaxID=1883 RepID=A0A3R7J3P3_9ACTN|nr:MULTISPECIES: hypothetical protein [Streptomyces]KNE84254.1 hypothetical protein ADZ36_00615 [Streptomyces fradiae]OFA58520.1 hypothetical protein BEN35_03520 [Streptomyces fradiae]PQM22105.1 hypothetical protein Sfr7A_17780 [Streptomyces xinghaiensis]RKM95355.1 hypothetical protein SFRA_014905 [Streptomyces xinghaiensis]RNC72939.1 hypothetical protein DC095_017330 [Streptomyces xinghaiensis]
MRVRTSPSVSLLAALAMTVAGLGAVSGCGSGERAEDGDAEARAQRARQVAAAWDGSEAATAWRAGFHPMGDVIRLPRGGLRSRADEQAFRDHRFVLEGKLPAASPKEGRVAWAKGGSLDRPLVGAEEAYKTLRGGRAGGQPHLTVTGAELGEMSVATSRGPAVIPAWRFHLKGYDSPLEQAAVLPSELPRPPIRRANGVPGYPLERLVEVSSGGRSVTVVALHGACDDGPVVNVLETRGSVVLSASVKGREDTGYCTKQAKSQRVTVELDRPVGDRVLLDAHTGRPVPYKPPNRPSPSWR